MLIDKISLLVAVHGKELGLKMLLIYVLLALTRSSVILELLDWSYIRFSTSFCFFNSEIQHRELMPKFSSQTRNRKSSKGKGGDECAQDD